MHQVPGHPTTSYLTLRRQSDDARMGSDGMGSDKAWEIGIIIVFGKLYSITIILSPR